MTRKNKWEKGRNRGGRKDERVRERGREMVRGKEGGGEKKREETR